MVWGSLETGRVGDADGCLILGDSEQQRMWNLVRMGSCSKRYFSGRDRWAKSELVANKGGRNSSRAVCKSSGKSCCRILSTGSFEGNSEKQ